MIDTDTLRRQIAALDAALENPATDPVHALVQAYQRQQRECMQQILDRWQEADKAAA